MIFYNIFQIKVLQAKNTSVLNISITDALETIWKSIQKFSTTQWMHKQIDRQTYWCHFPICEKTFNMTFQNTPSKYLYNMKLEKKYQINKLKIKFQKYQVRHSPKTFTNIFQNIAFLLTSQLFFSSGSSSIKWKLIIISSWNLCVLIMTIHKKIHLT